MVLFYNGRGHQEAILDDAKQDAGIDINPSRRLVGNQVFTLCAMMAHKLSRAIQMLAASAIDYHCDPLRILRTFLRWQTSQLDKYWEKLFADPLTQIIPFTEIPPQIIF